MGTGCGDILYDIESKAPEVTDVSVVSCHQCAEFGAAAGLALAAAVSLEVLLFSLLLQFVSTHAVNSTRLNAGS